MKEIGVLVFLFGFLLGFQSLAQEKALTLPSISISAPAKFIEETEKSELLDSSQFAEGQNSLVSLLANKSSVYVKNYGPGNLASIALRGTAAAHTAIVWKGIAINNSMLGMSDLSQINGSVLSGARIQEGGKTQMAVTENFGGILILGEGSKNKIFQEKVIVSTSIGSFSAFQQQVTVQKNVGKANLKLNIWNISAINDFKYEVDGISKWQTHSRRINRGLEAEIVIPIGKNLELESAVWAQKNESEIPPSMYQVTSHAKQKDENIRISNRLNWDFKKVQIQVGQGITSDFLHYQDPVSEIDSKSKVFNHVAWLDVKTEHKSWFFSGNIWSSMAKAETRNYSLNPTSNRLAFTGNVGYQLPEIPVKINGQVRAEHFGYSDIETNGYGLLPSLSVDWDLKKSGSIRAGLHKKMRLPTLNDLFWHPGGNPDLVPETGWTSDLSWKNANKLYTSFLLETNFQVFSSRIRNYIQWLPDGNIWKPSNIAEIQILGAGFSEKLSWTKGDYQLYTSCNFQITRSVQTKTRFQGDESRGKQLIYIPLWQNQIAIGFKKRNLEGQMSYQFTDRRFLDPTNTLWLNGFGVVNARLSYKVALRKHFTFSMYAEGLNLSKTAYQTVAGFAMPLRQYSLGIQVQFL